MREATHGGNVLLNGVSLAHGVVVDSTDLTGADAVDLLVDFGSGVVTLLTTASDSPFDCRGMPGTDASNLAGTSMCLTVKTRNAKSLDWANCTLSAGHTNGLDHFVVCEDICHFELLLELAVSVVNFLSDTATVDLDLHEVGLVLAEVKLADLSSAEHAHDRAVFLYPGKVALDGTLVILRELVTVRVLGESLPLCAHPVLVHSALDFSVEVLGPDSGEGTETAGSLDVADKSDNPRTLR